METDKLIFGAICLFFAFVGMCSQFVAEHFIRQGMPPDSGPRGTVGGGSADSAWINIYVANRTAWRDSGASINRLSGTSLFTSVVAGLAINFPALLRIATALNAIMIVAVVVLLIKLFVKIRNDNCEIDEMKAEALATVGPEPRVGA
jgi:hypothetical protein